MRYEEIKKLDSTLLDKDAKLSFLHMSMITQDALTNLFGLYNIDNLTVCKLGYVWVFTKNRIEVINNNLKWNDEYKIDAHFVKISHILVHVEILVSDKDDNLVFRSRLEATLLNIETRRLTKINTVIDPNILEVVNPSVNEFVKLEYDNLPLIDSHKVKFSSIDNVHHTNNIEYIRFIFDTLDYEKYSINKLSVFEIHYLKESRLNDCLDIYSNNNIYYIKNKDLITTEAIIEYK